MTPKPDACGADVLAVIPCLNEAQHLASVLDTLLTDGACSDALIVVADGGSTDGTLAIAEDFAARHDRVRVMHNPARRQGAAVNLAVRTYGPGARWLVRVDAHSQYPSGYLSRLVAVAKANGAQSVVVPMTAKGDGCIQSAVACAQNSVLGTGGARHRRAAGESDWVDHGHHALMAIDTFTEAGGYDERFTHNEDAELDVRLAAAGGRIWLAVDLAITYFPRRSFGALYKQYRDYGAGRAKNARLHGSPLKLRQAASASIAPAALLALAAPWFWPAAVPATLWTLGAVGYGLWLAVRTASPCAVLSGPAAMVMHFAWSVGFLTAQLGHGEGARD
jgi:succinoglycan biosynthesis protein ExoA